VNHKNDGTRKIYNNNDKRNNKNNNNKKTFKIKIIIMMTLYMNIIFILLNDYIL